MSKTKVQPREGYDVTDPASGEPLEQGKTVAVDLEEHGGYWGRRLREGLVVEVEAAARAASGEEGAEDPPKRGKRRGGGEEG